MMTNIHDSESRDLNQDFIQNLLRERGYFLVKNVHIRGLL